MSLLPYLDIDDVIDLENVSQDYFKDLLSMEPFGRENPVPLVLSYGCKIQRVRAMGKEKDHLELFLSGGSDSPAKRLIWFGQGQRAKEISWWQECDVVFYPVRNYYRGEEGVSLIVKDIRPSPSLCKNIVREIEKNMAGEVPLVVYTWVPHLAQSIVAFLQKQGIPSVLHSESFKGAQLNEVTICMNTPGGVILSCAPWLLKDFLPPAGAKPKVLLLHPPCTCEEWDLLLAFINQNRIPHSVVERWVELGEYWLNLVWPDKEYMEKTWKLIRRISRNDKFVIYEYTGYVAAHECCQGQTCRESTRVATESTISLMIELGLLLRDNARLPSVCFICR